MPVVHRYADYSGFYLRSRIDKAYVTFQVTPAAEKFLDSQGYGDEDSVSWRLIKPLWENGHVFSGNGGTTVTADDFEYNPKATPSLSDTEIRALQAFLDTGNPEINSSTHDRESSHRRSAKSQAGTSSEDSNSRTTGGAVKGAEIWNLPDSIKRFIQNTVSDDLNKTDTRLLIDKAKDRETTFTSIREFSRHPMSISDFSIGGDGDPCYTLEPWNKEWICYDTRESQSTDFVHILRPTSHEKQTIRVRDGNLQAWTVYDDSATQVQIDDLLDVLPLLMDFHQVFSIDEPKFGDWNFGERLAHSVTPEQRKSLTESVNAINKTFNEAKQGDTLYGRVTALKSYGHIEIDIDGSEISIIGQRKHFEGESLEEEYVFSRTDFVTVS